ncbi:MAG: hypothetical protein ABJC13_21265 [Acidobacteriota bacterium]
MNESPGSDGAMEREGAEEAHGGPGWRTVLAAAGLYLGVLVAIGFRVFARFGSVLPATLADPLQHLWILRWYESCLKAGRLPFLAPDVMFPVGAPLGLFSPLHLQALIWNLVGWALPSDFARYNLLWALGFLITAAGGFYLSWRLLRDRTAAVFGGLLCLLATPVTLHALGHLELIYVGVLGFFLLGWTEFVERPRGRSLAVAVGTYVLVSASAAYFAVMATIPAALFVIWSGVRALRTGFWAWLRARMVWLLAFAGIAAVALAILFSSQLWAKSHGFQGQRGRIEFTRYWAPLWGYFMPTPQQALEPLLPWHPYQDAEFGQTGTERSSYLGIVPLLLMGYAASRKAKFANSGFFWAAFALSVVLSLGAFRPYHLEPVWLPADWLWRIFPPMRDLRVPARFNLFAAVLGSLLAAAGLSRLLRKIERPRLRQFVIVGAFAATLLDLAPSAYPGVVPPPMPDLYRRIVARDPKATFHEAPFFGTRGLFLPSATAYWQLDHRGRTSGGYSGMINAALEEKVGFPSPFFARNLSFPSYLAEPEHQFFDVVRADAHDYVWAFLHYNGFRYAVVYTDPAYFSDLRGSVEALPPLLAPAEIDRNSAAIAYAADRLPQPNRAVLVPAEGLRNRQPWRGRWAARMGRHATFALYNPTPEVPIVFRLGATSFIASHSARVTLYRSEARGVGGAPVAASPSGGEVVIQLRANPVFYRWFTSDAFLAPKGWSEIRIDAMDETPQDPERAQWGTDRLPISLLIAAVEIVGPDEAPSPDRPAERLLAPEESIKR